jgi:hypothetical protein
MTSRRNTFTRRRFVALGGAAAAGLLAGRPSLGIAAPAPAGGRFVTEPVWNPPPVVIATPADGTAAGSIFVAPISFSSTTIPPGTFGPLMLDDDGEPVWFLPLSTIVAQNFRVQKYHGDDVLTWYEGAAGGTYGGSCVIYDSSYRELKRVHAGNGFDCDVHEFMLTSRNTALMSVYNEVQADLTSIGGATDGRLVEGIVQEIDIASKRVLFEWHSLDHVAIGESFRTAITPAGNVDYFHLNSIGVDAADDNLIVSARHTSTVYKIDRNTGEIIWHLGGMKNDFQLGPGAAFNFQHDARARTGGELTLFDNGATGPGAQDVEPASRPLRLALDEKAMTADLLQVYQGCDSPARDRAGRRPGAPGRRRVRRLGSSRAFHGVHAGRRRPLRCELRRRQRVLPRAAFPLGRAARNEPGDRGGRERGRDDDRACELERRDGGRALAGAGRRDCRSSEGTAHEPAHRLRDCDHRAGDDGLRRGRSARREGQTARCVAAAPGLTLPLWP